MERYIPDYFLEIFSRPAVGGNTVGDFAAAVGVFFVVLLAFRIFQEVIVRYLRRLAKRTKTDIDDMFIRILSQMRPPFYLLLAFYVGLRLISVNELFVKIVGSVLIVWVVYLVIGAVQILVNYVMEKSFGDVEDVGTKAAIGTMSKVVKGILWFLGGLFVLSNLGVNVTSVLAGLGIGGIAVALALQNILGDLFSSFAIFLDKPFRVGDFISVGEYMGTVEKIGIKTTRIRSLGGEEVIISNRELTESRIQNFKRMEERRIVFEVGVVYGTASEKLRMIPDMVRGIIEVVDHARPDRVHFKSFGDFSLNFEIVYYVGTREYGTYMDVQQEINLALNDAFAREGIEFAYPTQMVYHEGVRSKD